jgi:hypothetical protein
MSTQENVQVVKDFFAAMGRGDKLRLLALSSEESKAPREYIDTQALARASLPIEADKKAA